MFRNYVDNKITNILGRQGPGSPFPSIIWDNVLRQGYKHKSKCGFKVNACTGRNSQSLVMVGTDVTDEDLFIAGIPTTFKTSTTGGPADCLWSTCGANYLVSDVFQYKTGGGSLYVQYSGTCNEDHAMGIEIFRYTGDGDWHCTGNTADSGACIRRGPTTAASTGCNLAMGSHRARGQGGVSSGGEKEISDLELRSLLFNTKNILVLVFDDAGGCNNSGCNSMTRTMRYGTKSAQYFSNLDWDCGGQCHGKARGSCRTSGGLGSLNPFQCDLCLRSLEIYSNSVAPDVTPPISDYRSCMTINAGQPLSGCSSRCCKFYFPCSTDPIVDDVDPNGQPSCLRYDLYTQKPCLNPLLPIATRLDDCKKYSVDGGVNFPCLAAECCVDYCSEYANQTYTNGTLNNIIEWDDCPGNSSKSPKDRSQNSTYTWVVKDPGQESQQLAFINYGCKCGRALFDTWCFQNPKSSMVYAPWGSVTCDARKTHYNTTYGDLFNGFELNDTTSCAARELANPEFFCQWPLLTEASYNSKKVFQTCIDLGFLPMCPEITSVSPPSGPKNGGTTITITGDYFVSGATVTIGGFAATSVVVESATKIKANTPASFTTGAKNVVVTTVGGTDTLTNGFTYTTT